MRIERGTSPARLLEMLSDRFGAFEAIAYSTIKLARHEPQQELSMDLLVAEAVLEFADDLRTATEAATEYGRSDTERGAS
ncbi:MAG: hypothetical protein KY467_11000 [Gemmatimonadetes bacterium]|nr:hypothetical protein [Gemmatimonadota bacterium]